MVSISLGKTFRPIFSGDKLGLDLALLPFDKVHFWVMAHFMYAKDMVLHQVRMFEVMAVWDYEGKLESHGWSRIKELCILIACLSSPLAKMLRAFAQLVREAILLKLDDRRSEGSNKKVACGCVGLTSNVPFTPLEEKATTRVAAAQSNNAKVDLSAWALPMETPEEARAREMLWRFAVQWWSYNLRREAMHWWNLNGRDPKDLAAIQDCIFWAHACSYWH